MRIIARLFIISIAVLLMFTSAIAEDLPPQEGGVLPEMIFQVPTGPEHQEYLGLASSGTFTITDIKADVVIIEIFSMY